MGSVFLHTSTAFFQRWCASLERDGSEFMFVFAFLYVFGVGWACMLIPIVVLQFMQCAKTMRRLENSHACL